MRWLNVKLKEKKFRYFAECFAVCFCSCLFVQDGSFTVSNGKRITGWIVINIFWSLDNIPLNWKKSLYFPLANYGSVFFERTLICWDWYKREGIHMIGIKVYLFIYIWFVLRLKVFLYIFSLVIFFLLSLFCSCLL